MMNYLNIEDEKKLANKLYYSGGKIKYDTGGETDPTFWTGNYRSKMKDFEAGVEGATMPTRADMSGFRKGTSWGNEDLGSAVGGGLSIAGAAISALDNDPDYGGADVAGSAIQFASMGAAAGPIGAAVGGAIGLGVGLIKKGQFDREKAAAEKKEAAIEEKNLAISAQQERLKGFSGGGVIKKYNTGGEVDPVKGLPLPTLTKEEQESLLNASKNTKTKNTETKPYDFNIDPYADLYSASESTDVKVSSPLDYYDSTEDIEKAELERRVQSMVDSQATIEAAPTELQQNLINASANSFFATQTGGGYGGSHVRENLTKAAIQGDDEFAEAVGNWQQGSGVKTTQAIATQVVGQGVGSSVSKTLLNEGKEFGKGLELMWKGRGHWYPTLKGGLQSFYHGSKLYAAPTMLAAMGDYASDLSSGKTTMDSTVGFGKSMVNFYNPFAKFKGSRDVVKGLGDIYQDKDSKSAVRFLSLIPGNKGVRKYGLKIFKDYVPEVDVNPTGSTPESLGNLAQDFIKSSNVAKGSMFAQGGMTPGEFSHSTNPLTVVDKSGNDTGMELTGGEGVFDKPAMDKIKTLLRGGKFEDVGEFVSNEMETWKHK